MSSTGSGGGGGAHGGGGTPSCPSASTSSGGGGGGGSRKRGKPVKMSLAMFMQQTKSSPATAPSPSSSTASPSLPAPAYQHQQQQHAQLDAGAHYGGLYHGPAIGYSRGPVPHAYMDYHPAPTPKPHAGLIPPSVAAARGLVSASQQQQLRPASAGLEWEALMSADWDLVHPPVAVPTTVGFAHAGQQQPFASPVPAYRASPPGPLSPAVAAASSGSGSGTEGPSVQLLGRTQSTTAGSSAADLPLLALAPAAGGEFGSLAASSSSVSSAPSSFASSIADLSLTPPPPSQAGTSAAVWPPQPLPQPQPRPANAPRLVTSATPPALDAAADPVVRGLADLNQRLVRAWDTLLTAPAPADQPAALDPAAMTQAQAAEGMHRLERMWVAFFHGGGQGGDGGEVAAPGAGVWSASAAAGAEPMKKLPKAVKPPATPAATATAPAAAPPPTFHFAGPLQLPQTRKAGAGNGGGMATAAPVPAPAAATAAAPSTSSVSPAGPLQLQFLKMQTRRASAGAGGLATATPVPAPAAASAPPPASSDPIAGPLQLPHTRKAAAGTGGMATDTAPPVPPPPNVRGNLDALALENFHLWQQVELMRGEFDRARHALLVPVPAAAVHDEGTAAAAAVAQAEIAMRRTENEIARVRRECRELEERVSRDAGLRESNTQLTAANALLAADNKRLADENRKLAAEAAKLRKENAELRAKQKAAPAPTTAGAGAEYFATVTDKLTAKQLEQLRDLFPPLFLDDPDHHLTCECCRELDAAGTAAAGATTACGKSG
ncbi:hypothetical protein H9P43_009085 [Blastocladiella emersonii ATCC 22665]|nr:hypothetical protein H9P43_009085 [Blastocladiella emersonii ATCC 22665]